MSSKSRVVNKGGFKFKRPGLSLNKPLTTVTSSVGQPNSLPLSTSGIQIISETRPPPKLPKHGSVQMSITSFANKPKPVATVMPQYSPPKNNPSQGKRKREPAVPKLGMFVASTDDIEELDDFDMPSISHYSPRAPNPKKSKVVKLENKEAAAPSRMKISPSSSKLSHTLDDSTFSNSLMEDMFKDDSDDEDLQHIHKRARRSAVIASDSEDDAPVPPSPPTRRPNPPSPPTRKPNSTSPSTVSTYKPPQSKPCPPTTSVKPPVTTDRGLENEQKLHTDPLKKTNYSELMKVMDEVCDIIGRVSAIDLMTFISNDYDRLQKLLFMRKQIKDRLNPSGMLGGSRRSTDTPPNRSVKQEPIKSEFTNESVFSPQPSSSRLSGNFRTPDINQSIMKSSLPVTSTAIKKTSAVKMQLGSDSPIPCGDSFFDDDVALTQTKMKYMKGFKKSVSSPRNSSALSPDNGNSTMNILSRNSTTLSPDNAINNFSKNTNYNNSSYSKPEDSYRVDHSGLPPISYNQTSVYEGDTDYMNDTSKHGSNYNFDYSLQEGASTSKNTSKEQKTNLTDKNMQSLGNYSMNFDDDFPDDMFGIEEFQDMEDSKNKFSNTMYRESDMEDSKNKFSNTMYRESPTPQDAVRSNMSLSRPSTSQYHQQEEEDLDDSDSDSYKPMFAGTDKDDGASGLYDGHNFPHSNELVKVFRSVFGLREFRHNQLQAINASLLGLDTFILMPTGGGKSLCYQLPALVTRGVCIVISPLRALIQDQVQRLISLDIPAAHLSSDIDQAQAQNVYCQLSKREPGVKLLYVTPEKLSASAKLLESLFHLYSRQLLDRFIIDEAHCVSQWGHDFRPDYKKLNVLRQKYPGVPVMALTATATPRVRKDIIHQLAMKDPKWFMQSFNRPNLKYLVLNKKPKSTTPDVVKFIKEKYPRDYGIVYCLSRNECDTVATELRKSGIQAVAYHAGLGDSDRVSIQDKWLNGDRCKVICATIAFGMGIDKPDVRFVIHYSLPKSVEGYYQEAGRAGRDGILAECVLFYSYQDVKRLRRMVEMDQNATYASKKVHIDNLYRMVQYAENVADCRRAQVLQYFGEHHFDRDKCNDVRGATCDNCASKDKFQLRDVTEDAKAIVKCVGDLTSGRRDFTMLHFVEIFKGSSNTKITENGHNRHPMHGRGKAYSRQDAERLFRKLVVDGVLMEELRITAQEHAVCYMKTGKRSAELNQGKIKVELQVQGNRSRTEVAKIGLEAQSDYDKLLDECYKELLTMAKTIAREHNIKNYASVFPNQMLWQLADKRPLTLEELRKSEIEGLTDYKISRYGAERFLDITTTYVCMFSTLEDDRRCSSQKEEADEEADAEWTSRYFEESSVGQSRGRGRRGGGGGGWRGKKNFKSKRGKKSSGGGRGKGSYKKAQGNSSFSQYSFQKGKKAASSRSSTKSSASAPSRGGGGGGGGRGGGGGGGRGGGGGGGGGGGLGLMPVPQPRSFLASNMFLMKK